MALAPTLHLNGTGAASLQREYYAFYKAVNSAIEALADATLNARDYYVQGPEAYSQARAERDAAFAHLGAAKLYAEEMLSGIMDQARR